MVQVQGKGLKEFTWPSGEVDFCGSKIDRTCDKKSGNPKISSLFNYKGCFSGNGVCEKGYTFTDGHAVSRKGNFEYGWQYDNSKNLRCSNKGTNLNDKCNMLFPNRYSKACESSP